jgi:hypothetical protein
MKNFLEYLGLILIALMILAVVKSCVDECVKEEQKIHDCYIQEPKTKECEYILWKEELKVSQDDDFVTGMLLGQAMSGGLR